MKVKTSDALLYPEKRRLSAKYLGLTEYQAAILEFVRSHYRACGLPPTLRQICEAFPVMDLRTVHSSMGRLVDKGYLEHRKNKMHAYVPVVPPGHCPCCRRPHDG